MTTTPFLSALSENTSRTVTENGAPAYKTTGSDLLDFFSIGGTLRDLTDLEIVERFARAYSENRELAVKAMFYFRDIRGGQGQRHAFRVQLRYLSYIDYDAARACIIHVPTYGRWDDLYALFGTDLQSFVIKVMHNQITADLYNLNHGGDVSLCAKWLKSENASSDETRLFAIATLKGFGWSVIRYRKTLSLLRKHIGIVERKMSSNEWGDINYQIVPSNAMMKYHRAFKEHDADRFVDYLDDVKDGKSKITYEIVEKILKGLQAISADVAQAQWDAYDFMLSVLNSKRYERITCN